MTDVAGNDGSMRPETLWGQYRDAFGKWASQVDLLSRAQAGAESGALADALQRTTAAEATYRESRRRLTESMAKPATAAVPHQFERASPPDRLESK